MAYFPNPRMRRAWGVLWAVCVLAGLLVAYGTGQNW
jgi:hypothetical protein